MISVSCPPDQHLHLAEQSGNSVSAFTLCLCKWKDREPAREGSIFCPECVARWAEQQKVEEVEC